MIKKLKNQPSAPKWEKEEEKKKFKGICTWREIDTVLTDLASRWGGHHIDVAKSY
jgi:hypothetical protein